jgi:hypothetical protein
LTFTQWKYQVSEIARKRLEIDDLWRSGDPYELQELARSRFADGATPQEFFEDAFAEDLAGQEYDSHLDDESAKQTLDDW